MSKQTAYPDLLPWGHLAGSGMVFTKDSQIVAGYYFRPPDADSRTGEDADALSDHVNAALTIFGSGFTAGNTVTFGRVAAGLRNAIALLQRSPSRWVS